MTEVKLIQGDCLEKMKDDFKMNLGFILEVFFFILVGYTLAYKAWFFVVIFLILSMVLAIYTGNKIKKIGVEEWKREN